MLIFICKCIYYVLVAIAIYVFCIFNYYQRLYILRVYYIYSIICRINSKYNNNIYDNNIILY